MNKKLKVILLIIFLGVFSFSLYKVIDYFVELNKNEKSTDNLIEKAIVFEESDNNEEENEYKLPFTVNFGALKQQNKDIVGWLYSKDTPINNPILQSNDNAYYLRRLITGEYNHAGSLFMDYRNDSKMQDYNTIIYGHNIKNETMFGSLPKYKNQDYYENHKFMYYFTPEKNYLVRVFCACTESTNSKIYTFNNLTQNTIDNIIKKSDFTSDVTVTENDKIITLSTCAYEYEDARYIVLGKLEEIPNEQP